MIPNVYPGAFIVVDGIDGCGKSKQFGMIVTWLRNFYSLFDELGRHIVVVETKEPDKNSVYGKAIYVDLANPQGVHATNLRGFQAWYACDSRENLEEVIVPGIKAGQVVVSDRFRSSMVYGALRLDQIEELMRMNQDILGHLFVWPDVIFIIDTDVNTAIERLRKKGRKFDGHEKKAKLETVRKNYQYFATQYPNCRIIDGNKSEDKVFEQIRQILLELLKAKSIIKG